MLLAIDVGNTNISLGIMDGDTLIGRYRLMTKTTRTSDEYGFFLVNFLTQSKVAPEEISDIIISSVVPKLMYSLTSAIIKYLKKEPLIIDHRMDTGIKVITEAKSAVGADRIVNTSWAWNTYHSSAIIVDFGTATTFDYVNNAGEFRYTVIMPGLETALHALTSQTAKLPEIEIVKPASVLGTNTIEGMQAGAVYGYIGSCEYIIRKMKEELNDPACTVIATGGLGRVIARETDTIDSYDPDIAYKGMKMIYDRLKEKKDENI